MSVIFIAIIIIGVYSIGHLLWAIIAWEVRWDLRLIRLVIHAALFGAGAAVIALLWAGRLAL
jgi:hypothetical protein